MNHNPRKCKVCNEYHCLAGCVPVEDCIKRKEYKQGKEVGIKKVVEWIRNQSDIMVFINMHREDDWKAKLKEWGVDL